MNKRLLFLILMLVVVVALVFRSKRKQWIGDFASEIIRLDTANISSLHLKWKADGSELFLKKEDKGWIVSDGILSAQALPVKVRDLLGSLHTFTTEEIAARNSKAWPDYGVDLRHGIQIEVFEQGSLIETFHLGRSPIDSLDQRGSCYLRIKGEEEVYRVDSTGWHTWKTKFMDYRSHMLLDLRREEVGIIRVKSWLDSPAVQIWLDSTYQEMEDYLLGLQRLEGERFDDGFDPQEAGDQLAWQLSMHALDSSLLVEVYCFRDTLRTPPFTIYSSQYPDHVFLSDSLGLYQILWPGSLIDQSFQ